MGPRRPRRGDQAARRPRSPARPAGSTRFVAGSIGPTGFLPASDDPTLGQIHVHGAGRRVRPSRPAALIKGGVDLVIIETAQDILEVKAAVFGAREAFKRVRPRRPDPVQRLAPAAGRQDAARDRHQRGADHARGARRRRDRAQLLDRSRGHARCDPLPRRALPGARALHPQRRPSLSRARTARRSSPRSPSRSPTLLGEFVERYGSPIVGGCCGTTPDHIARARRARARPQTRRTARAPRRRGCRA